MTDVVEDVGLDDDCHRPPLPGERLDLVCPEAGCGSRMVLRESKYGLFYGCSRYPLCISAHGADKDGSPRGIPGDEKTRRARERVFRSVDQLNQTRADVLLWAHEALGLEGDGPLRIAALSEEQCLRLIRLIELEMDRTHPVASSWRRLTGKDSF